MLKWILYMDMSKNINKARVKEEHRNRYILQVGDKDISATTRGKLHLEHSLGESVVPKVGDYVHYEMVDDENAVITEVLARGNSFVRRSSHDGVPQVIATNVDIGIVVQGLDGDFNIKRLERYLKLIETSGARAAIVLNKRDVVSDTKYYKEQVKTVAPNIPLFIISAKNNTNMEEFEGLFKEGETAVFLGSSGAGKSTLTNYLLNSNTQAVKEVREDDSRGRHTTTSRQLFTLPNGAFIIDTPGMRELSLLESDTEDGKIFSDIEELKNNCQFRDCDHERSEGCAVLSAIENGDIKKEHYENYLKLRKEEIFEGSKVDVESARIQKSRMKQFTKQVNRSKAKKRFEGRG